MTDRELLEKAAKAAGMDWLIWTPGLAPIVPAGHRAHPERACWNPLTDDGDALRLAVKLQIDVTHHAGHVLCFAHGTAKEHYGTDKLAATRRCITRAAAAIGEGT